MEEPAGRVRQRHTARAAGSRDLDPHQDPVAEIDDLAWRPRRFAHLPLPVVEEGDHAGAAHVAIGKPAGTVSVQPQLRSGLVHEARDLLEVPPVFQAEAEPYHA